MILRAISIMILSMALLAGADAFFKLATLEAPVGQAMAMVSFGGTLLFIVMAAVMRVKLWTPEIWHPMVILRNLFEVIGAVGMIMGVKYISLPVFAAITQTGPLIVTLGAALFLGEKVGLRRWIAIGVGLFGMALVIRPWSASFTGYEFIAVMGIAGLSARDLVTRLAPDHIPALAMSTWGFAAPIPIGLLLWWLSPMPTSLAPAALWPIAGAIAVTTVGYLAITTAMRMAPVSIVAPFRYTRLIFTPALGILFFGDRPDAMTLFGAGIILVAGLYTFIRERQLSRSVAPPLVHPVASEAQAVQPRR